MQHRSGRQDQPAARLVDRLALANGIEGEPHLIDAGAHGKVADNVSFGDVEHHVYGTCC